jgi:hypothetical protein
VSNWLERTFGKFAMPVAAIGGGLVGGTIGALTVGPIGAAIGGAAGAFFGAKLFLSD